MNPLRLQSWSFIGSFLLWLLALNPIAAEIIPDTTLPNNSTVTPSTNTRIIEGGTRRGNNLFHSFREFSFSAQTANTTGDTAFFNNDSAVRNIITRITGGSRSIIDGKIQANGTANLFFINPNGIIFGQNASLQIGGSFVASTATSLKFADGAEFSAIASQTSPLLTVSVPTGLQFGSNPRDIVNQSQASPAGAVNSLGFPVGLQIPSGKTLALVGGNVSLVGGNLTAAGGRVELGSVAESDLVTLSEIETGFALDYAGFQNFENIQLSRGSQIDTSDSGSGAVQLQGRNVTLSENSLIVAIALGLKRGDNLAINATGSVNLSGGSQIGTFAESQGQAGDVLVRALDSVELVGTAFLGSQVCVSSLNCESVTGNGGNLIIETRRLLIRDGSIVDASTFGAGQAGNVIVKALDTIELVGTTQDGLPSGIFAQVADLAIDNPGNAGTLSIETQRLIVKGGAQISTAARKGGNGGNLTVNATDMIQLSGASSFATASLLDSHRSGIFVSAEPEATGNVGTLNISTGVLTVEDGARISADNLGSGKGAIQSLNIRQLVIQNGGEVRSGSFAEGSGGTLTIKAAESVEVTGRGTIGSDVIPSTLFTRAEATGKAGNLAVTTQRLNVKNGAEVTVSSTGSGQAGNLEIIARSLTLDNEGKLIGKTASADGGNIALNLRNLLLLRRNSEISTSAGTAFAGGNGGAIAIDIPDGFIVTVPSENSDITANAFSGKGGSVTIDATGIFGLVQRSRDELEQLLGTTDPTQLDPSLLPTNDITAISRQNPSLNGQVIINTPDVDPNRGLVQLPTEPVNVEVVQGCQAGGQQSSSVAFFNTGRGGLPVNPYEPLSSSNIWEDVSAPPQVTDGETRRQATNLANLPDKIVEAQGWVINKKGEVVLVAEIPDCR
ncbi:filamentous hemagglutinin N-terminal domain-containing protein [Scytonema sp. NUACC26]|uniref:two-partner secretion domain-containing protein n=1 Tax=Scytonema sp. NUACC26 TaxID=3140176 RepID=UPI0034DBCC3F